MVESEEEDYLKFICIFYKIADSSAVQFLPCFYLKKKKKSNFVSAVVFYWDLCIAVNIVYELRAFVFYLRTLYYLFYWCGAKPFNWELMWGCVNILKELLKISKR